MSTATRFGLRRGLHRYADLKQQPASPEKAPGGDAPRVRCASRPLQSVTTARAVAAPAFTKYAPVGSGRKFRPLVAA